MRVVFKKFSVKKLVSWSVGKPACSWAGIAIATARKKLNKKNVLCSGNAIKNTE